MIMMMSSSMIVLVLLCCIQFIFSIPYYVPLQGTVGGKRTLILLDNMVRFFSILMKCIVTLNSTSIHLHVYILFLYPILQFIVK